MCYAGAGFMGRGRQASAHTHTHVCWCAFTLGPSPAAATGFKEHLSIPWVPTRPPGGGRKGTIHREENWPKPQRRRQALGWAGQKATSPRGPPSQRAGSQRNPCLVTVRGILEEEGGPEGSRDCNAASHGHNLELPPLLGQGCLCGLHAHLSLRKSSRCCCAESSCLSRKVEDKNTTALVLSQAEVARTVPSRLAGRL